MTWPVTTTKVVYDNPWMRVREDSVVRPDGSPGIFGVVELHHPAVFVVAITDADEVVLVTVDRHTVGTSVEVPAGGSDGDDPLTAAKRELLEETGLTATTWQLVGTMNALNGLCRATESVFLATGLASALPSGPDGHDHAAEEGITRVERVPVAEVLVRIASGRITDGETIAALMLAMVHLGRVA